MGQKRGCFKTGCMGCGGLLAVVIIFTAIMAGVAWKDADKKDLKDEMLSPVPTEVRAEPADPFAPDAPWRRHPGRLVLELGQGEFELKPAPEGEGLSARAQFDAEVHEIAEHFEVLPDSSWVYGIRFRRHMPGMQAMFRALFGQEAPAKVQVYIPRDVAVSLEVMVEEGGFEAELGGLWLPEADIHYNKGGFALSFDEPLREPMQSLKIAGSMGGFQAVQVGNASPRSLLVHCRMGGADLDLTGAWAGDSTADLSVSLGGMDVRVPDDMIVEGVEVLGDGMNMPGEDVPVPTMRLSTKASMGEIEVRRR